MKKFIEWFVGFVAISYVATVLFNFFHRVDLGGALVILTIGATGSFYLKLRSDLFSSYRMPLWFFPAVVLFSFQAIFYQARFVDTHVYHLPGALLMNKSVWFPGIGHISHHMAFPNASSVISSLFTSTGIVGIENLIGYLTWIFLGVGVFLYLSRYISKKLSLCVMGIFLLSGNIYFQMCNMGTDLPCVTFMLFGLLAVKEKKLPESLLFLALSAGFKPLGLVAFGLVFFYSLVARSFRVNRWSVLALVVVGVTFLRTYLATGNPFYPLIRVCWADWGFSVDTQERIVNGSLLRYSGVERTVTGAWNLLIALFVAPIKYKSADWFSTFFLVLAIPYLWVCKGFKKFLAFRNALIIILFSVWFVGSPLIRFVEGLLMYMTIQMVIQLSQVKLHKFVKGAIAASMVFTFLYFMDSIYWQSSRIPAFSVTRVEYPLKTPDGRVIFSEIKSTTCGRSPQPCINKYTVDKDKFLKGYLQHNFKEE